MMLIYCPNVLLLLILVSAKAYEAAAGPACPADAPAVCFSPKDYKDTDPKVTDIQVRFPGKGKTCWDITAHTDDSPYRTRCCHKAKLDSLKIRIPYGKTDLFRIPKKILVNGDIDSPPMYTADCY